MPNAATPSWRILLPLLGVLILAIVWSIYWFVALGFAKDRMATERANLADRGLTISCSEEWWGGYPFHFEWTCSSPVVTQDSVMEARASNMLAVALAYAPWQVVILLDGPTTLSGQKLMPVTASHGRIVASVTLDQDWAPRFSMEIPKLSVPKLLSVERVLVHTRPAGESMDVAAALTTVDYQPEGRPVLVLDQADMTGTLLPDRTLFLDKVELRQGTIRYWGSGSLSLDSSRRVAGTISTETNDLNGLLSILEPHLALTDQQKASLRMLLGLMGNAAKADIISKDGQLFVGPFKVSDVPPLY